MSETMTIATHYGPTRTEVAATFALWAVTRGVHPPNKRRVWRVTHVPSGYAAGPYLTKKLATEIAKTLSRVLSKGAWQEDRVHDLPRDDIMIARGVFCAHGFSESDLGPRP